MVCFNQFVDGEIWDGLLLFYQIDVNTCELYPRSPLHLPPTEHLDHNFVLLAVKVIGDINLAFLVPGGPPTPNILDKDFEH